MDLRIKSVSAVLAAATLCSVLLCGCEPEEPFTTSHTVITAPTDATQPDPETLPPISTDEVPGTQTDEPDTVTQERTEPVTEQQTTTAQTTPEPTTAPEKDPDIPDFTVDLSSYEKYMNPEDRDAYLILVNPSNPVGKDHKPTDLEPLVDTRPDRSKRYMRLYAAKSLEAFLKEARANGCKNVTVTSAYRSYDSQKEIFDGDVKKLMEKGYSEEEAIAIERKDTAFPGESEHQTGLAVDMHNLSSAQPAFADTYEAKWLAENAWKFGFILRYLPDKEEITTYVYEPWHFRYVGRYHAKRIYEMGMCLEEYIEYLANN